jgi:hypothetical protein
MSFINAKKLRHMSRNLGGPKTADHLCEALKSGELKPTDFSIANLAEGLIEDGVEFVRNCDPRQAGDGDKGLMEAVDSTAFKKVSGQVISTAIMQAFENPRFVGDMLHTNRPTRLNGERIDNITEIGDKATVVDEGKPFPEVGVGESWIETPQTTKRGMKISLTKEAIFFDRTGILLDKASQVGHYLGVNKEKRHIDLALGVVNNYKYRDTAYDTYQTTTPWDNVVTSNGLHDWTDIDAALQTFGLLVDPDTGDPIMITPIQILCHSAIRKTVDYVLNATHVIIDPNAAAATQNIQPQIDNRVLIPNTYEVISSPWVDARYVANSITTTTWFFGDFRRAFAYMENWPIAVVPMPANSTQEYELDIMAGWKVSERGVVAVMEPRETQKNTHA